MWSSSKSCFGLKMQHSAQHLQIYITHSIKHQLSQKVGFPHNPSKQYGTPKNAPTAHLLSHLFHNQPSIILRVFIWLQNLTLRASVSKPSEKFLLKAALCRKAAGSNFLNNSAELKCRDPAKDTTQSSYLTEKVSHFEHK